jgi:hypothetical protein
MLTNLLLALDEAAETISSAAERLEHVRRHEAAKRGVA